MHVSMCACVCIWLWAIHDHFYAAAVTMGGASVTMGGAYVTMGGEAAHSTLPHTRFFFNGCTRGAKFKFKGLGPRGCMQLVQIHVQYNSEPFVSKPTH